MKRIIIITMLLVFCVAVSCDEGVATAEATTEEAPQEITPEAALNYLSIAVAKYEGSWEEHLVLRESLRVIAESLGLYETTEK